MTKSYHDAVIPRRFFRLLLSANLGGLFVFATNHILAITLPLRIDGLGHSSVIIGTVVGTASFSAFLFRFISGTLIDYLGSRITFLLGSVSFLLSPVVLLLISDLWAFFLAGIFQGVGFSLLNTTHITYVARLSPSHLQGRFLALATTTMPLSLAITPHLTTHLITQFSYQGSFITALTTVLSALVFFLFVPPLIPVKQVRQTDSAQALNWKETLKKSTLLPSIAASALGLGDGVLLSFLPLYILEQNIGNFALFFTAYALLLVIIQPLGGLLVDKLGAKFPAIFSLILFASSFIFIGTMQFERDVIFAAVLCAIGFGIANSALTFAAVKHVEIRVKGKALGTFYGLFDLGRIAGLLVMGLVVTLQGYSVMFLITGVAILVLGSSLLAYNDKNLEEG